MSKRRTYSKLQPRISKRHSRESRASPARPLSLRFTMARVLVHLSQTEYHAYEAER
jgi:hypothetical protein